jgi:hypothetical protein
MRNGRNAENGARNVVAMGMRGEIGNARRNAENGARNVLMKDSGLGWGHPTLRCSRPRTPVWPHRTRPQRITQPVTRVTNSDQK